MAVPTTLQFAIRRHKYGARLEHTRPHTSIDASGKDFLELGPKILGANRTINSDAILSIRHGVWISTPLALSEMLELPRRIGIFVKRSATPPILALEQPPL
jgi:hypothetical protein